MEQFKLRFNEQEKIRALFATLMLTYPNGGCFFFTDREKVTYKQAVKFDVPDVQVGKANKPGGVADTVLAKKQVIHLRLDESYYGVPAEVMAGPLWTDDEQRYLEYGRWLYRWWIR